MKFCIITHVVHTEVNNKFYGYSPYINEMNIWLKNVDSVIVVAPKVFFLLSPIHESYSHSSIEFVKVKKFDVLTFSAKLGAIFSIISNCILIYKVMKKADHIHLRCPGNIGLLGCIIQLFFPKKQKTAKYAGNWDPNAKQPLSYKIQKWILSNSFITKNMQVLVYGEWKNQSKNSKPFFTATYAQSEIIEIEPRKLNDKIKIIFVGTLSKGKQPLYAIKVVEELKKQNFDVELSIYGDGNERFVTEGYIKDNNLSSFIFLKGNIDRETMKAIYQESHFLILPSKSEGWPKVVAEAMFWGCLPISTSISCAPNMLGFGDRGILLTENLLSDVASISKLIANQEDYNKKIKDGIQWSHQFTIDKFEHEIKNVLKS